MNWRPRNWTERPGRRAARPVLRDLGTFDPMRIHYLQHVPFEDPAGILDWASAHGCWASGSRLYARERLPGLRDFDLLVVMGGPMGVRDMDEHPWMEEEAVFIADAVSAGRKVLGVCLGAQIMAAALGARVRRARRKEIGFFEVERTPESEGCPVFGRLPERFTAFHWHGDTFELPEGATRLAFTPACVNQAFRFGDRAFGLQFHVETTAESRDKLIAHCAEEIVDGPFIQSASAMRAAHGELAALRPTMETLMASLAAL